MNTGEVNQARLAEDNAVRFDTEQLDTSLAKEQAAAEKSGNLLLASILAITRHLNETCQQYEAEAQSHLQSYEAALEHLAALQQQLQFFLALAQEYRDSGQLAGGKKEFAQDLGLLLHKQKSLPERNLWQRLQNLVRLPSPAQPAEQPLVEEETGGEGGKRPFLAIYTLGPFQAYLNDKPIRCWSGPKTLNIFKFFTTKRGDPISKDLLMDTFWPDAGLDATRRNLHQAIYTLRQALRQDGADFQHILFENDSYCFNPRMKLWLDFVEFEKHVRVGQYQEALGKMEPAIDEYDRAESLYQGDFLADLLYEDWPRAQREQLRHAYIDVATRLSNDALAHKQFATATKLNQKILKQDHCYEDAHYQLMYCYVAQGLRHLAIRQYHTLCAVLDEELGLPPAPKTVALFEQIS